MAWPPTTHQDVQDEVATLRSRTAGTALTVDLTNTRVGIGTTTPARRLHVDGTGHFVQFGAAAADGFAQIDGANANLPGTFGRDDTGGFLTIGYKPYFFLRNTRLNQAASHETAQVQVKTRGTVSVNVRATAYTAVVEDDALVKTTAVTAATNASPIAITATAHGYTTGDRIIVSGATGNTAANGAWVVTVTGANTFTLDGSTGNGAYTGNAITTNRPMMYCFMATVKPSTDRGSLQDPVRFSDDVNGYAAYNSGTGKATDAFYLGRNTGIAGPEWDTGVTIDANTAYAGFAYNGTLTGVGGSAIFKGANATISPGAYLLTGPNNAISAAMNAAGNGFVDMFKVGTDNKFTLLSDTTVSADKSLTIGTERVATDSNALTTGESTLPRELSGTSSIPNVSGVLRLTYFTARKTETINSIRFVTGTTAAAGATLIRMGIYSVASNGDLTLVASTVNDTALFNATFARVTKALSTGWSKTAMQRYAAAFLFTGTTAPTMYGAQPVFTEAPDGPRLAGAVAAQTDLPSSITAGTVSNSNNGHYMLYASVLP